MVDFNKENSLIELLYDNDTNEFKVETNDNIYTFIDIQPFANNFWLFSGNKNLFSIYDICIYYVCIYQDMYQTLIENDKNLLTALNVLSNNVFKEGLIRDINFYISG